MLFNLLNVRGFASHECRWALLTIIYVCSHLRHGENQFDIPLQIFRWVNRQFSWS